MTRQERIRRASRLSPVESLETRNLMTIAATAQLPDLNLTTGAATVAPVNLDAYFKDANAAPNYAMVNTSLGTIPVLLTPQTTPLTVANFENYVAKGSYTNTIVHRSVPGFIWQTGGYQLSAAGTASVIATDAPVKNEFGASNVRGTIAMAKLGSDPNSATSQFFFNESDSNAANLDTQNSGFTVFGHVVGAQGLAVMDAVAAVPVPSPPPLNSPLDQIPLQNYTTGTTVQPANLVLVKSVTMANELFTTTSDTPGVATATVQGGNLTITPVAAGTAHITVVGYGSDGKPATESFAVNVTGAAQPVSPTPTPVSTPTPTPTPTSTPTPAPTPTPTATTTTPGMTIVPPVVVANRSVLTPVARGQLPAAVVAGRPVKIGQTVILRDAATTIAQREQVALKLSTTTTGAANDVIVASAAPKLKLKAGQQTKLNLTANRLGAGVSSGTYHVLVSVTDPDGAVTTVDTGKTLKVINPRQDATTADHAVLR